MSPNVKILLDHTALQMTSRGPIRDKLMVCQSLPGQIMVCWSLVSDDFKACCSCKESASLGLFLPSWLYFIIYSFVTSLTYNHLGVKVE